MRLHSSYTSPYVRKVKIFLVETGLFEGIEEVFTNPADEAVLRPLSAWFERFSRRPSFTDTAPRNPPGRPAPPPQSVAPNWVLA